MTDRTVRIDTDDLAQLIHDRQLAWKRVTELQAKMTEMIMELRSIKAKYHVDITPPEKIL